MTARTNVTHEQCAAPPRSLDGAGHSIEQLADLLGLYFDVAPLKDEPPLARLVRAVDAACRYRAAHAT